MGGRFAGEVPGIELSNAASMSSRSNADARHDPVVGVDLDDAEDLGVERRGPLVAAREAVTTEDEALAAGRNDGRRDVRDPEVGDRPHVYDLGIPTVSDPRAHHATTIVTAIVVGQDLRHRVPVARREVHVESLVHLACCVFQPRRRPAELFESRERGVDVCLVEQFERLIRSPSTVERSIIRHSASKPCLRNPVCHLGDDRSEVAQTMHSLDVALMSGPIVPRGADVCGHVTGREGYRSPVVDVHPVRRQLRELVPVECGEARAMTDHVCA